MKRSTWIIIDTMTLWVLMMWLFNPRAVTELWQHPVIGLAVAACTLCGVILGLWSTSVLATPGIVTGIFCEKYAPASAAYVVLAMTVSLVFSILHMGLVVLIGGEGPTFLQTYLGQGLFTVSLPACIATLAVHRITPHEKATPHKST